MARPDQGEGALGRSGAQPALFAPDIRIGYRVGLVDPGVWSEILEICNGSRPFTPIARRQKFARALQ